MATDFRTVGGTEPLDPDFANKRYLDALEAAAATSTDLAAHEAAADPHPGYLTPAEADVAYEPADATILKDADIGVTVASVAHSHAYLPDTTTLDAIPIAVASVNFNGQQATSFRIENRTDDPVAPAIGQVWLRTNL